MHRFLLKFGGQIIPDNDTCHKKDSSTPSDESFRVFVPLCGKTIDMAFLANQPSVSQVVGIDGIQKALVAFAQENPSFEIDTSSATAAESQVVERYTGKKIELLRGDLFDLDDKVTNGKFNMILDRGSIVAIQPTLREQYINTIGKLIKPGGSILLIAVDRRSGSEEAMKRGPPFSVDEQEVRRLYGKLDWVDEIKLVDEYDEFQHESQRQRFEGLDSLYELCFVITAKN